MLRVLPGRKSGYGLVEMAILFEDGIQRFQDRSAALQVPLLRSGRQRKGQRLHREWLLDRGVFDHPGWATGPNSGRDDQKGLYKEICHLDWNGGEGSVVVFTAWVRATDLYGAAALSFVIPSEAEGAAVLSRSTTTLCYVPAAQPQCDWQRPIC